MKKNNFFSEHELIIELCKFVDADKDKLEHLMERNLQWPYILGQLLYHRMGGAAYLSLNKSGLLGKVNREFRNTLKTVYDSNVVKAQSMYQALGVVADVIQNLECPYALLKGAYLLSVYPIGLRTSNDVDVLISQEDISKLEVLLKAAGFVQGNVRNGRFTPASRKEIINSRINRGETVPYIKTINLPQMEFLEIDINFSLDFSARKNNFKVVQMLKNSSPLIQTTNGCLCTLDNPDFLIHLCCHLYKEASIYAYLVLGRDLSLYKFADIYLLLYQWSNTEVFTVLSERIHAYGLQRECYYAFLRTKELFGIESKGLNALISAIKPQNVEYLKEIFRPEQNKVFQYDEPFAEWLFVSSKEERLHENIIERA